jgi:O-antigen/teichoic acid export membrane protein
MEFLVKVNQLLGFSKQAPTDALERHAHKREHLIRRSAVSSVAGRVVASLCMLVQVPLALHYLGAEAFGFWMTITGVISLMAFADLGLGNGLQNRVAELYGTDDLAAIRQAWICGAKLLTLIGIGVFLLSFFVVPLINWGRLFHLQDAKTAAGAAACMLVISLNFCIGLPLTSAQKIAQGMQLGWIFNLSLGLGSFLSLIATGLAIRWRLELPAFLALTLLTQQIANVALVGCMIKLTKNKMVPVSQATNSRALLKTGAQFFVLQLGAAMTFVLPPILLATKLGTEAVVPYNLTTRVLSLTTQFLGLIMVPLWPAYGEAKVRGDHSWIRKSYKRSLGAGAVFGVLPCLFFAIVGPYALALWSGKQPSFFPWPLVVTLSLWVALTNISQPVATLLNGLGHPAGQAFSGMVSTVIALGLMPVFIDHFGTMGVPLSCLIPFALINSPFTLWEASCRVKERAFDPGPRFLSR